MSGNNRLRFFYNEYERALQLFDKGKGDVAAAEEACCQLIADYECPRLLQLQAHQLRSLCTSDYQLAKSRLQSALELTASLKDDQDPMAARYKAHTELMLADLETKLEPNRKESSEVPTKEQSTGGTMVEPGTEAAEEQSLQDTEIEQQRQESDHLNSAKDDGHESVVHGASPAGEGQSGGAPR